MSFKLFAKAIFGLAVIYGLMVVILIALNFSSARAAYVLSQAGKKHLLMAASLVQAKDWLTGRQDIQKAQAEFEQAEEKIETINKSLLTAVVPGAGRQLAAIKSLLTAAQDLSEEMLAGLDYLEQLTAIFTPGKTFSQLNKKEKRQILAYIYDSGLELAQIRLGLDEALNQLNSLKFWGLLFYLRPQIMAFKAKLAQADDLLSQAVPSAKLLPAVFGYPKPKTFLFLLQNSDELRPTGGFIGTYGLLKTDSGDIEEFTTDDIYHLDMPIKDKLNISPPPPIKKYLNKKWYLRDSNWAPDFPTAAQKALWFFGQENRLAGIEPPRLDGVIAITPAIIVDLLKLNGPITIEGQEYNSQNFSRLLEYRVEKGYVQQGIPSWQRKEVIGQIAQKLKIKLFDLPLSRWPDLLAILSRNIKKKNILFYFTDKDLAAQAQKLGADGAVKSAPADYLLVVDFNMAAYKTDAVMKKSVYYKLSQSYSGAVALLRLTYEHQGGLNWRTARYQTYVRVYVPAGSKLLAVQGIDKKDVYVGQEFGHTFFGVFFAVEPQTIGSLSFSYKLPEAVNKQILAGRYSLLAQKQPGNRIQELAVDLNFKNKIQLNRMSLPAGFTYQILNSGRQITAQGEWPEDLTFKIKIKKD